jgi:hypothetical protein
VSHNLSSAQSSKSSTLGGSPINNDKPMSLKHEQFHAVAASAPEPMGTVVGKLGIAWAGFFAGMSLGDWVLLATLVYTLLQITLLIVERIIKPILAAREVRKALRRSGVLPAPSSASSTPQEK